LAELLSFGRLRPNLIATGETVKGAAEAAQTLTGKGILWRHQHPSQAFDEQTIPAAKTPMQF
jgi:hypothetical protein